MPRIALLIALCCVQVLVAADASPKRGVCYNRLSVADAEALKTGVSWCDNWYHAADGFLLASTLVQIAGLPAVEVEHHGAGSIATVPPDHEDVRELFAREPCIEPELAGRALPTNDWWTTLLARGFPERLYPMPAIVGADGGGLSVWYPQGWDVGGTQMLEGRALRIEPVARGGPAPDGDRVVVDFEHPRWPSGWTVSGDAFGPGAIGAQADRADNFVGRAYAEGFKAGGDRATGSLTTGAFTVDRRYLHLLVAGGSDGGKARIEVVVDGRAVASVSGANHRELRPAVIDLAEHQGRQARLRLVDETGGSWGWIGCDHAVLSQRAEAGPAGLLKTCRVADYGDWHVVMRLRDAVGDALDVTLGRGLPTVWVETAAFDLRVPVAAGEVADLDGRPLRGEHRGDGVRVTRDGRPFALIAPRGTRWALDDGALAITLPPSGGALAVCLLSAPEALALHRRHALAVPRETRFDFTYDPVRGMVDTSWTIRGQALVGDEARVLQGWLPHHWRSTEHDLAFVGADHATQRGRLRLAAGSTQRISWRMPGLVPSLPLPAGEHQELRQDLARWTADRAAMDRPYGDDTYWGAKDPLTMARAMLIAHQLAAPEAERLESMLRACLSDWFSYQPGEDAHYFARYGDPWRGVVGFKPSYGSAGFTDNHFHYGYFILSAALLGLRDPAWLRDHAVVAALVARQYASWDRDHADFPYLRTFDPWGGHSYAGGMSSPGDGNNQESSSEAMQSWAGLFLLGAVLGDERMRACGAMGYAIEGDAVDEYWNDWFAKRDGPVAANFPPQYPHPLVSVLRDRDIGHWTWFSGKPIHIYGIQWLPNGPTMHYFGRRPELVRLQVDAMRCASGGGEPVPFASFGDDWGNIALMYHAWAEPAAVLGELDRARAAGDPLGGWKRALSTRALATSLARLGRVDWDAHADLATSLVFVDRDGRHHLVAWNPQRAAREVVVHRGARPPASISVPPGGPHLLPLP